MDPTLTSLDLHIAWVEANMTRRAAELTALTERQATLTEQQTADEAALVELTALRDTLTGE